MKEFLNIILNLQWWNCTKRIYDLINMMDLTEDLISSLTFEIYGKYEVEYEDKTINLAKPWRK